MCATYIPKKRFSQLQKNEEKIFQIGDAFSPQPILLRHFNYASNVVCVLPSVYFITNEGVMGGALAPSSFRSPPPPPQPTVDPPLDKDRPCCG